MSGAEVLGVISAVIGIVDGMKQLYDAASDTSGLPEAFRAVAARLPLVQAIATSVRHHLERDGLDASSHAAMMTVLDLAQQRAGDLKKLFDKVVPLDEDPPRDRYLKLARTLGKGAKVETLMAGLMTDVQLLVSKTGLENSTAQQVHELRQAIQEISDMEPSIPDHEFPRETFSNNHYGSGSQTNNNVAGDAKVAQNYGSGKQYLAETQNFVRYERPETPPDPSAILPFGRDKDFTLRGDILDCVRRACDQPGSRIALVGLGGVGKSQLAIEYAYQVREESPDTWVFWVHASNAARFGQGFREIADHVKIPGRNDPQCNIFQLVRNWLRGGRNRRWRLILDNVDDASFIIEPVYNHTGNASQPYPLRLLDYLPVCPNGSILITSRTRAAARELVNDSDIISVEPMSQAQAVALIETKLPAEQDRHLTEELASALECMPLAIIEATAYISQRRPLWSVQRYLEQFDLGEPRKAGLLGHEGGHLRRDGEAENSILATWRISFDHIRQVRPQAADLLALMSFFDRQGIPSYILRGCREEFCTWQGGTSSCSSPFDDEDFLLLRDYSFISFSTQADPPASNAGSLEMHRLVQVATRMWLQESGTYEGMKEEFLDLLSLYLPSAQYENWATWRLLLPHARSAEKLETGTAGSPRARLGWATVLYYMGCYFNQIGNTVEAERVSIISMETFIGILGRDDLSSLRAMGTAATAYHLNGRWKEAEKLQVVVMEALRQKFGTEDEETLDNMSDLARTLHSQGRWDAAVSLRAEVVDISKRWLGADHPDTVQRMEDLVRLYLSQGRLKAAETLEMEVMEIRKRVLGTTHPRTLDIMANLASIMRTRGRWGAAERLGVEVLEIHKQLVRERQPPSLQLGINLAHVLRTLGLDTDAIRAMELTIGPWESHPGFDPDHPSYVVARKKLDRWKEEQPKQGELEE